MFNVIDTNQGPCPLCMKDKDVLLFVVQPQREGGYNGGCCAKHLAVLIDSAKNGKKPDNPPQQ